MDMVVGLGKLPSEIGNLVNLEVLSAASGSLTGPIPSFIFNMSSLRVIDFKNNSLSGSLPLDIQYDLPFLKELRLDSNKLSAQFPPGLWECKWLQILSLESNDFTGSISNNIGNLTLLRELSLGLNKLTGTSQTLLGLFPTSLHSKSVAVVWKPLAPLKTQDLNFTLCEGALPEEIGNLNLERLSVSFTCLTYLIPSQIFNKSTTRIIILDGNQFSSHLPSSLGL
ncbi:Leucine-rich repeat receptor protein kinase MSP1 [Camellia lanceoleosa]|uniref:Leucine-rich repeat receptor protein kinase MSP1 n=1 Tax=Camellia lanceoleosa TaxID=1840588 RepID=A0ACC0GXB0_9ERIC|nr:Leucine-rich repeat receptor protein kinase MSP1 [Camellia lanceoleosa]